MSINGGERPRWRRDGKELYFVGPEGAMMAVETKLDSTFSAGIPRQLFRIPGGVTGYDVHPDGRFLIVTPSAALSDNPITVVLNWWAELTP